MPAWKLLAVIPIVCVLAASVQGQQTAAPPVPVLDLHSDIINRCMNEGVDMMTAPDWVWTTIPKMKQGHVAEQVYSVWVDSRRLEGLPATERALHMIDFFNREAERWSDHLALARNMDEADRITASGRVAGFLWIEGGAPINDDLALLRVFHDLGIRGMTLSWMNNLNWAGASTDRENPEMGLTEFGREVIREMNRLGMVVDLSHVSDQTFWDALEVSTAPVILTHSGCKALSDHPRNVTDDMLRAVAKSGGVAGIVAYPTYLDAGFEARWDACVEENKEKIDAFREKYIADAVERTGQEPPRREVMQARIDFTRSLFPEEQDVTLDGYLDHIEHAMEVAGWQHVALGSDFDGIFILPKGMKDAGDWQMVAEGLRKRGHSEEVVRGVMGENTRRVFRQVMR